MSDMLQTPALTKNQNLVLDALSHAARPLSAYTILDQLRGDGLRAPLQVYRALDKLLERGLIHRLESLKAFIACRHSHCHTGGIISFAICETCDKVLEFSDDIVTKQLGAWSRAKGFRPTNTTLEIRGTCADCEPA